MKLTKGEQQHYNRHLILQEIDVAGQLKLKKASVLVVGAGGLGCPVLQYLTAAGVGNIGVLDDDVVDKSNLQRQILYTYDDIGKNKAKSVIERLQRLNPFVNFTAYPERLSKENAIVLFEKYDIVIDGSDNFPTRYLINDTAVLANIPVVFGSIFKFEGQVSVFNYKNGPTYRCLYPTPPKLDAVPNCSEIGVLGVLPGIIGCLQANEALKIILHLGGVISGKLVTFNALSMNQLIFSFKKDTSICIESLDENYQLFCGTFKAVKEINSEEYEKNQSEYNVLDVRTDEEYKVHHIKSIHIPLSELPQRLKEIPENKKLLVVCKSGVRSKLAIELLQNNDFKKEVVSLKNGLFAKTI